MPATDHDKPEDPGPWRDTTRSLSTDATAARPAPPALPDHIGRYRIKRVIDTCGMGTVYEAVQDHPRRPVALKVMKPGIASPSALRRFEQESQVLGSLHHPNIAQVYEAGTHDDGHGAIPFFAMEYVPSARPLTRYAREKHLSARERLELFVKVCDAVHHGHRKGIVHRDLKPGNILVDGSGEPKVIDFGVARTTDSDLAVTTQQTDVGQLLGTVQYMSPEQVEADPHAIDPRSDVYALGVVLYELLSDKLPYAVGGVPLVEAARIIKEEPPTRLSTLDTKLRGDLETIVLKALDKEPGRRYQSAHELGEDITRYLNDEPIVARRPTLRYILKRRTQVLLQRHPVGTALAIIGTATLLTCTIGVRLVHDWTPAFDMVKAVMTAPFWPAPAAPGLEQVRVIRITDDTVPQIERLARAYGFTDVTWDVRASVRRLHGRLMERLAEAGVASVTWDMTFRSATEYDADFVAGVEALAQRGIDVVVGVRDWPLSPGREPEISEHIAPHVCWGGATTKFNDDEEWNIHLFLQRGTGDAKPALALRSLAAYRHPGTVLDVDVDRENGKLLLRYKEAVPQGSRAPRAVGTPTLIELTGADPYDSEPALGRQQGDLVGTFAFKLPPRKALEAATVDYEWVFDADLPELRRRLGGKAVVIGNFRAGVDRHPHARQGLIPGPWGHAVALDWLLAGRGIRGEDDIVAWVSAALGALVGVLIAGGATGRVPTRGALLVAAAVVYLLASLVAYHVFDDVFNPLLPLLAMLIASELAVAVNRARRARLA